MKTIKIKMFGKKSFSTVLYWIIWACLVLWLVFQIDAFFFISGYIKAINIFTDLLLFTPISIMLVLLILIFKELKSNKMFTPKIVKYLSLFGIINICMPLIYITSYLIMYQNVRLKYLLDASPFILLAVFSFFLAAIFKQGFQIQQENELTI